MQLVRTEQHMPSSIIDRDSVRGWQKSGGLDAFGRAKVRVQELLASYITPTLDEAKEKALHTFMIDLAQKHGMDALPLLDDIQHKIA